MHQSIRAAVGGLAGAAALTLLHESLRRVVPNAPRLDLVGMRAMRAVSDADGDELRLQALAGDLATNTLYFSLAGLAGPRHAPAVGAALGAAAGAGSVLLSGPLGLGKDATSATPQTALMTIALYAMGGALAGGAMAALGSR